VTTPWPRIVVGQRTDPGRNPDKQENEDSSLYQETHLGHLLLVCDGMGGHASGREASTLAVSTIATEVLKAPQGSSPGEALRTAMQVANRRVYEMGGPPSNQGRPGSTCVALLIHPLGVEVAHLGDSRAYLVRGGQIWPLTRDHSMVQQMVDAGLLRPEEVATHPDNNKISRALGMESEAQVELRTERVLQQAGDLFLLVTDGVTDVARDTDLLTIATLTTEASQMPQLCGQVVQLANARGGPDNLTIVAAFVSDPGLWPNAAAHQQANRPATTLMEEPGPPRNQPFQTVPAGGPAAPLPLPPATATPLPTSPRPSSARGAGGTVKLAVHQGGSRSTTVIDEGEGDEEPEGGAPPPSRAVRIVMGIAMMAVGALLTGLSSWALLGTDEAPPPLLDGSEPAASGGPGRAPSAAPKPGPTAH
jgi:protein phosphatase